MICGLAIGVFLAAYKLMNSFDETCSDDGMSSRKPLTLCSPQPTESG